MYLETQQAWISWTTAATTASLITPQWQESTSSAIAVASANDATYWFRWVVQQNETAEQRQHRQQANAAHVQRLRDGAAARQAASERAERLLNVCLSTTQRGQLQADGWFEVRSASGRRYRIRRGRVRNVIEVNMLGRQLRTFCCHPLDNVPDADTMLAQKLMLETQEDEFLRLANVS